MKIINIMNISKPIHSRGNSYPGFATAKQTSMNIINNQFDIPNNEIEKSIETQEVIKESNTMKETKGYPKPYLSTLQPPNKVNEFKPYLNNLLAFTPQLRK